MIHPPAIPTLAKAEVNLYQRCLKQIREDLKLVQKAFARFARNMATIRGKRLYYAGGYATFEEFCQKEIGKTRQQVYRIIAAHDTLQHLLTQGIPETELPETERLCREIRVLPVDSQAPVWKAVMRIKREKGRSPTIIDIQEEAVKHVNSSATIERQQKEVLTKLEGMARGLKMGLSFDTLTEDYRRRLTVALMAIADSVKALLAAINSPVVAERVAEEQISKAKPETTAQEINRLHSEIEAAERAASTEQPAKKVSKRAKFEQERNDEIMSRVGK